jgi:hypothetical protein
MSTCNHPNNTAAEAKRAFKAAQDALALGNADEAARLLERWRELAPRPNISREETP